MHLQLSKLANRQSLLGLTGLLAWGVAAGIAASGNSDAIGTAFVTAGLALLLAAAFFDRVTRVGPSGVELVDKLPPAPDRAAQLEREAIVNVLRHANREEPTVSYNRARIIDTIRAWLIEDGWSVPPYVPQHGDVIAEKDRTIRVVRVAPRALTKHKVREIVAARDDARREFVKHNVEGWIVVFDQRPVTDAAEELARSGIGLLTVDPQGTGVSVVTAASVD